jgi:ABC-type microcin C transport system permease subunit YejB
VSNWSNQSLQRGLQNQQDEIQAHQLTIQSQQQQLQAQQQLIDSASQLANQVGPSVIRDLATLQLQNKNQKIAALLKKYGIEAKAN